MASGDITEDCGEFHGVWWSIEPPYPDDQTFVSRILIERPDPSLEDDLIAETRIRRMTEAIAIFVQEHHREW